MLFSFLESRKKCSLVKAQTKSQIVSDVEAVNSIFTSGEERLSYNFNFHKPRFVYTVSRRENLPLMRS